MSFFQKIFFQRMDQDTEARAMAPGSYREAWNVHVGISEGNKGGIPVKTKGNQQIAWPAPGGTNRCIGTYWDEGSRMVYAFIYNSNGQHTIIRLNTATFTIEIVAQDPILNFQENSLITGVELVGSGTPDREYLYWTDYDNELRKINVQKALNVRKTNGVIRVYFNRAFDPTLVSRGFTMTPYLNGVPQASVTFSVTAAQVADYYDMLNAFANGWNANAFANVRFTAKVCGDFVELTETGTGFADWVGGQATDFLASGTFSQTFIPTVWWNRYTDSLDLQLISRAKFPPECEPSVAIVTDESRQYNYISRKSFQFAVAYRYDDGEATRLSPYSVVTYDVNAGCDPSSTVRNNCIEIDFASELLPIEPTITTTATTRCTGVKEVEVFMRLADNGEGVPSDWYSVEVLPIERWAYTKKFRFYNDGQYAVADPAYTVQNYDFVPIKSKAMEVISDRGGNHRMADGGIIEGYDNPCIEANVALDFQPDPVTNTRDIVGKIRILNAYSDRNDYATAQPIHNLGANNQGGFPPSPNPGTVFGGIGPSDFVQDIGTAYEQWLPEAGWPVYLAGTQYWAISEQVRTTITNGVNTYSPTYLADNVMDTSRIGNPILSGPQHNAYLSAARDAIDPPSPIGQPAYTSSGVYSTFRIRNVPPGTYVLRLASHLCSFGDVLGKGSAYDLNSATRQWQRTSTFLGGINGSDVTEIIVTVPATGTGDIDVTPGVNDFVEVVDLTNATLNFANIFGAKNVSGYLYDNEAEADLPSATPPNPLWGGTPMEKQRVYFRVEDLSGTVVSFTTISLGAFVLTGTYPTLLDDFRLNNYVRTDHNGFFFMTMPIAAGTVGRYRMAAVGVTGNPAAVSGGYNSITGAFTDFNVHYDFGAAFYDGYYNGPLTLGPRFLGSYSIGGGSGRGTFNIVGYNQERDSYDICRTTILGTCEDANGVGIPGVNVVLTNGSVTTTSGSGTYSIITWGNALANFNDRNGELIFSGVGRCRYDIPSPYQPIPTLTFNENQQYSRLYTYTHPNTLITIIAGQVIGRWKRGGKFQFGIIYKDEAGRMTFVVSNEGLNQYIPFYTEDLNKFDPYTYPVAGTYNTGNPVLSWTLDNQVPIPTHGRFTHYQWFRTKDTALNFWLQWVAKEIIYSERWDDSTTPGGPVATTYNDPDVTEIYFDLENLTDFQNENTDSMLGYVYQPGDRLRLIADHNGVFYQGYYDVPITGQRGQYVIIEADGALPELERGVFFEIYTPKLQTTEALFYELVGECYEINDAYGANPTHSVTSGVFPAGDCWFRPRQMPAGPLRYTYTIESQSVSDFFASKVESIGRLSIIDASAKQLERPTAIRLTNPYLPNTDTNGLSQFEGLNIREFDRSFGLINALVITGDRMLCICANRKTVSIYVGQAVIRDVAGQTFLAISDDVLGNNRPLEYNAGTVNPESVVVNRNAVYFFDNSIGEVLRATEAGIFPISDYGMRTYWSNTSKNLRDIPNVKFPAVYDRFHEEYLISVPTYELDSQNDSVLNLVGGRTAAFYDPGTEARSWSGFFNFYPEYMSIAGQNYVSFKDGQPYLHNTGTYTEFYGINYPARIKMVANMEPSRVKTWLSLTLESMWKWAATMTNDRGQETSLAVTAFSDMEGQQKADIRRDVNTPNVTFPILNGSLMKSEALEVEISNSDNEQVSIFATDVYWITSEKTNR